MTTRYVVARHCFGGIGDHLSCLIGAWWLARRTGRTLVVDWRGSRFNADVSNRRNCFFGAYQPRASLGGVEVIADDRVESLDYPRPIYPGKWSPESLAAAAHLQHTADEVSAINHLVTSDEDPAAPTVVLNQWVEPLPGRESVRLLLRDLQHGEPIRAAAQTFWSEHIGSAQAVAIHVRHGNGENIGGRAAYWLGPLALAWQLARNARTDVHRPGIFGLFSDNMPSSLVGTAAHSGAERRFCRHIAAEFHALTRATGLAGAVPILFCDAAHIGPVLREFLPSIVERSKRLPPRGDGPLHQLDAKSVAHDAVGVRSAGIADDITRDMFVELELMRRCSALLYMNSGFSLINRFELDASRVFVLEPGLANQTIVKIVSRLTRA